MSTQSTQLTRIEVLPSTNPIAVMLRGILAWMDRQGQAVVVDLVQEETLPPVGSKTEVTLAPPIETEVQPAPEGGVEKNDGLLKPEDIADKVGALLWAHRSTIEVALDHDEKMSEMGRHSDYSPEASIKLPGGLTVSVRLATSRSYGSTKVTAPDGQSQDIPTGIEQRITGPWACIVALGIVDTLGLDDLLPADIEDDGTTPSKTLIDRLGQAIGKYVERRAPAKCAETYMTRHYIDATAHSPASHRDAEYPSRWQSLGQDVLLRIETPYSYGKENAPDPVAYVSHPVYGTLIMNGKAIQMGLDRRKSNSLSEALGMALQLPAHLPMPRGNAQAARVLRLCREAVAAEPDLMDRSGTPIRPLVDQHLPELMRRHAAASAIAQDSELAGIDADLMEGIDRVKKAVEEALSCSAVARRQALTSQLRFLELRHPDSFPQLESIPCIPALAQAA